MALARSAPDGVHTISWSMALLGARSPVSVFFLGVVAGGVLIGLPFHFWWGMMPPEQWDDYQAAKKDAALVPGLRDQISGLAADNLDLATKKAKAEFALSDCLAGVRDPHGYPPELRIYPGPKTES